MDREIFDNELNLLLTKAEDKIPDENLPDLPFMELAPMFMIGICLNTKYGK